MTTTPMPELPPFGSKRAAALALYKPPFRYEHGYIFDAENHMVADQDGIDGEVKKSVIARVRGWGRIGYMPDASALQDEVGEVLALALTEFWNSRTRAAIEASQVQSIDDIHSCSFFCELPACVKTQRDLLRDKLTKETK